MKIKLRYPANARLKNADGKVAAAFGNLLGEFEIPEADAASYPIAIELRPDRREDVPERYRFDPADNRLFRWCGKVAWVRKESKFKDGGGVARDFASLYRDEMAAAVAWAKSGKPLFGDLPRRAEELTYDHSDLYRLAGASLDANDLHRSAARTQAYLDGCLVVDGVIWEPCEEPVLRVSSGHTNWWITAGNYDHGYDWHDYVFGIDEFEFATAWLDTLDSEFGARPRKPPTLHLDPAYRVTVEGAYRDARNMAAFLVGKIAGSTVNLGDHGLDVLDAYVGLRKFVARPGYTLDDEAIEGYFELFKLLVDAEADGQVSYKNTHWSKDRGTSLKFLAEAYSLHLRRWEERPIREAVFIDTIAKRNGP